MRLRLDLAMTLVQARPTAGPFEWIAAAGLIVFISYAISWIAIGMGMQSKSVWATALYERRPVR